MVKKKRKNERKRQMFLIMMVCTALAAVLFLQQYQEGVREIKQGIYRSDREGEAHEETFVAHMEDGTRVEVPVSCRQRKSRNFWIRHRRNLCRPIWEKILRRMPLQRT